VAVSTAYSSDVGVGRLWRDPGNPSPFRSDTWLNGETVPGYFPHSERCDVTCVTGGWGRCARGGGAWLSGGARCVAERGARLGVRGGVLCGALPSGRRGARLSVRRGTRCGARPSGGRGACASGVAARGWASAVARGRAAGAVRGWASALPRTAHPWWHVVRSARGRASGAAPRRASAAAPRRASGAARGSAAAPPPTRPGRMVSPGPPGAPDQTPAAKPLTPLPSPLPRQETHVRALPARGRASPATG
jgi:hypothetical protein